MGPASRFSSTLIASLFYLHGGQAQSSVPPARITATVDERTLVQLVGSSHPLARPEFDRGAVPDDTATNRILVILKRSPVQEQGLTELLNQQLIATRRFRRRSTQRWPVSTACIASFRRRCIPLRILLNRTVPTLCHMTFRTLGMPAESLEIPVSGLALAILPSSITRRRRGRRASLAKG